MSSSSVEATTGWSLLFIWPKRDISRWCWSAARNPAGRRITEEFYPGFRCSILAHAAGPLRPDIVRDMQLEKHGLRLITPDVGVVCALARRARADSL